jgi:hypothetical protein
MQFAPGPPGLKSVGASPGQVTRIDLDSLSTAEPGIQVASEAEARYRDSRGTPAVVVRQHGKGRTVYLNLLLTPYYVQRTESSAGEGLRQLLAELLKQAGVSRSCTITSTNGRPVTGVEVHPWRCGNLRLLGLHRNYTLNLGRNGDDDSWDQKALRGPLELKVDLGNAAAVYETRTGKFLGEQAHCVVTLNDIEPAIFSLLPERAKGLLIQAPERAVAGNLLSVSLRLEGPTIGKTHTFRAQIFDPGGQELTMLTRNLAAPQGSCTWELPLATNLQKGTYTLRVREIATGLRAERLLKVG